MPANGSFTITSNAGSFVINPTADLTTEGAETFTVSIRTGSITGPIVATSNTITVNDTSVPSSNLVLDFDAANFTSMPTINGSFNLNGSSQYLSIASSSAFAFGTNDFTIETWIYPNSLSGRLWFFSSNSDNVDLNGNGGIYYYGVSGTSSSATNTVITVGTWHHIALVRASGTITLYVNGVSVMSQSGIGFNSSSNRALDIGYSAAQGNNYFNGRISNFRIVKGTAVYTANFTPTTQPLSPITNTVLLIRPQDSGTLLTDYSTAPLTVTNNGTVTYNAATPFTTITDATGNYPITITNPTPRISWSSENGGVFRVTTASTNNFLTFGPNYGSAQAFTVGMAYKWNGTLGGRLLNANTASPDFLMGLWGSAGCKMNIAYGDAFVGSSADTADTAWHFIWFTNTGSAGASKAKSYIATSTAPSGTYGTGATNNGFNGLRLFGRFVNSTTSSEQVDADVGFVKVWNKELSLAEIQAEHATYKARFGY